MRYAIIPKSSGDRVAAWFCTAGEEGVIHVVVAGRGHTYKVWMSASGLLSREIL